MRNAALEAWVNEVAAYTQPDRIHWCDGSEEEAHKLLEIGMKEEKINGNPIKSIYVYSRPEWTALVTRKDSAIAKIEDLKGKRVAVTRGTDPHIFLVRALLKAGLSEKDITPVLLQHPDGKTALIRGDVDAWAGLDPMMAQAEVEDGARLFYRNKDANTWGILNVREEFLKDHPDLVKRVLAEQSQLKQLRMLPMKH